MRNTLLTHSLHMETVTEQPTCDCIAHVRIIVDFVLLVDVCYLL